MQLEKIANKKCLIIIESFIKRVSVFGMKKKIEEGKYDRRKMRIINHKN